MTDFAAPPGRPERFSLPALRERLARDRAEGGRRMWRSVEEIADAPEFVEMLHREFPDRASEWDDGLSRRNFLHLMGASLALAGLTACTRPTQGNLIPYVKQPEELLPGKPLYYATALTLGGVATGVLVESHMGRPTKIEGNPDHPASLGASTALMQAAILGLYDPDRSRTLTHRGEIRPFPDFVTAMHDEQSRLRERSSTGSGGAGAGLAILTGAVTSPTLAAQIQAVLAAMPRARWHQWEAASLRDAERQASLALFGRDLTPVWRCENADVLVTLDADILSEGPASLPAARAVGARRSGANLNRLYAFESFPTPTGAVSDHRFRVPANGIAAAAAALAAALGVRETAATGPLPAGLDDATMAAIARDLRAHSGRCLVAAGARQPALVHALAAAMNAALGNVGTTLHWVPPPHARPVEMAADLASLVSEMQAGRVRTLIILNANPVYDAPADLRFREAMERVPLRVHLGERGDETAAACHWHIPAAHELECWSDARAHDGTVTICQPLIDPLSGGRSAHEVLAALTETPLQSGYDIVRAFWKDRLGADFEKTWRRSLHDGFIAGSAHALETPAIGAGWPERLAVAAAPPAGAAATGGLVLQMRPDPSVWDGRFANNGWLQELPRPMTKLTWDNAAILSPETAERSGLERGDVVEIRSGGMTARGPVWVLPGHPEGAVTVHLGYGRTAAGRVGNGVGFDAGALRGSGALWHAAGASLVATGERYRFATTQEHQAMEGRELVRLAPLHETGGHGENENTSLYEPYPYDRAAWGMTIDLASCIGCNACTAACNAENNVPVVGKQQVAAGREMHWIRVDRYFEGDPADPEIWHQPVPCMQCENAPCEQVCPVAATVHSEEGLNDMVYNRCVGTRYCSNNCPYKVRRFNFLQFADFESPLVALGRNPDVTVRSRGVMEKCTYCVQRINHARNEAEVAGRPMKDGDITTACEQACPAKAITFGNINDPSSRIAKAKADPRNYTLLDDLNTKPRTSYLAAVRNPNPELAPGGAPGPGPARHGEGA